MSPAMRNSDPPTDRQVLYFQTYVVARSYARAAAMLAVSPATIEQGVKGVLRRCRNIK